MQRHRQGAEGMQNDFAAGADAAFPQQPGFDCDEYHREPNDEGQGRVRSACVGTGGATNCEPNCAQEVEGHAVPAAPSEQNPPSPIAGTAEIGMSLGAV